MFRLRAFWLRAVAAIRWMRVGIVSDWLQASFTGSAILRKFRARRLVEQTDLHAGIAAARELLVGRSQRLIAGSLAQANSLARNAELFQLRHDDLAPLIGQLPVVSKRTIRRQRTTRRVAS